MSDLIANIQNLKIHFYADEGIVKAVDGVNLSIRRGKTLCVVGESGSGKSVTARALLKIVHKPGKIIDGSIKFHTQNNGISECAELMEFNETASEMRQYRGGKIAMIFQEPMTSLSPMYTVGNQIIETILNHKDVTKDDARKKAIYLLTRVGIPNAERLINEYPFRLSGGMRQRVMIAMALSCDPELLIADEPTTALDVTTQAQIIDLLLELQNEFGMAIMFITHDLGVVAEIADDVAIMYLGKVVETADVDTVFNSPKHPYTKALLKSIPTMNVKKAELIPIEGIVPSPFERSSGCGFSSLVAAPKNC